jgi:hypothetical protein
MTAPDLEITDGSFHKPATFGIQRYREIATGGMRTKMAEYHCCMQRPKHDTVPLLKSNIYSYIATHKGLNASKGSNIWSNVHKVGSTPRHAD